MLTPCVFQTTALLSHVIYFFALHPDVLKKAREEILEVLGPEAAPTVENMRGLKYREPQKKIPREFLIDLTYTTQYGPY